MQQRVLDILRETRPAMGTIVESYLGYRDIHLAPPPCSIRFHPELYYDRHLSYPAMVCVVRNAAGRVVAIHRTWITTNGNGTFHKVRKMLGPVAGAAVRLGDGPDIVVAEGIETALSAVELFSWPSYAALSAPGVRTLKLPPHVRRIVIAADGDDEGRDAAHEAAHKWLDEGRKVRVLESPERKDLNDRLTERADGAH
jgi:hypothetical protein